MLGDICIGITGEVQGQQKCGRGRKEASPNRPIVIGSIEFIGDMAGRFIRHLERVVPYFSEQRGWYRRGIAGTTEPTPDTKGYGWRDSKPEREESLVNDPLWDSRNCGDDDYLELHGDWMFCPRGLSRARSRSGSWVKAGRLSACAVGRQECHDELSSDYKPDASASGITDGICCKMLVHLSSGMVPSNTSGTQ